MKLKRLQNIAKYISSYDICTYEELCKQFNVSLSTIRRDLNLLESEGKVEKVFGGVKINNDYQIDTGVSALLEYDYIKDMIAQNAARLVEDGDIIMLGSGSTVAHMIKHLKHKKNVTIITNNLLVLNESLNNSFNVISIGGTLDRNVVSFVGLDSAKQLDGLNANKCFISCNGVNLHAITNVVDIEADIKKGMIKNSDKTILLAGHEKFDKMSLYSFTTIEETNYIITDKKPNKEYINLCKKAGCELIITGK